MLSQQEALNKLKKSWQIEEMQFLGVLDRPKNEDGSLKKIGFFKLKLNDRALKYPLIEGYKYHNLVSVFIPDARTLVNGKTYYIKVRIAGDDDRTKFNNPFLLAFEEIFEIEQTTDVLSPKDFIANWFGKKGENPGDAASIAAQLRLNQLELYTQTKRFVFELIQNADDMPLNNRGVEIDIRLLQNYFLFQHTGQYFTRENVKAICDAAQSTKRNDETKTGYKGIGFKSVFSDSEKVFIYSQDYSFKFDKSADVYGDFRGLYKPYWNKLNTDAQRNFFLDFEGHEDKYTNIDNIPWQIKPIWVDIAEYPEEVAPFINKNKNVNISLAVGEAKIREKNYNGMIASLVDDPTFLLFLRNTKSIRYIDPSKKEISIRVIKEDDQTKVYTNDELQFVYASFQNDIEINNDAFADAGFDLEHVEVEENKFVFKNKNGKILENIPEKLGKLSETIISFAVKIENDKILPIRESESILYNYLPTSDDKYRFPFIVNADFVSKTDREGILAENVWNHYLFYHIGYSLIRWVNKISEKGLWSTYLKILPKTYLDEDNQERSVINAAFNRGLKKGIDEIKFVIDSGGKKRLANEVVYDKSGLANIIGSITYLEFINSEKHLTNNSIEELDLKIHYLEIEVIGKKKIKAFFDDNDSIKVLNSKITSFKKDKYQEFLGWLNSSELSYDDLSKVKFIAFGSEHFSLEDVYGNNSLFLFDDALKSINHLIKNNGGKISAINLSSFQELYEIVVGDEASYYHQMNGFYLKIVSFFESKISTLSAQDKYLILEVLRSIGGIDVKTVTKLPWYKNALGELKSLPELYNNEGFVYSSKYNDFFLHHTEIKNLSKIYLDQLNSLVDLLDDEDFYLAYTEGEIYDSQHEDIRLLEIFLKLAEEDANIYQSLAKKITWNGTIIDGDLYLDQVTIKFTNSEDEQIEEEFRLVELVSNLTISNKSLDELLSNLNGLRVENRELFRSDIFKLKEFKKVDIIKTIQSKKDISISYRQFFYLAIDAWFDNKTTLNLGSANFGFIDHFTVALLDYIFDNKVDCDKFEYIQNEKNHSFLPKNKFVIFDNDLLHENEIVAKVYESWIGDDKLKCQIFIEAGCFDESNLHYQFRKALSLNNISVCLELLSKLEKNEKLFEHTSIYIQKFGEQIYDNNEQTELIIGFYNLLTTLNSVTLSNLKYPFLNPKDKKISFHPLATMKSCYKYNIDEWMGYEEEIISLIEEEQSHIIHKESLLPSKFQNQVFDVKISSIVNKDLLDQHSELFSAPYYENWNQKEHFPINIYSGSYIPYTLSFCDLILDDNVDQGKLIYPEGNSFYVSKKLEAELPFCLSDMDMQAWRSLTEAKFYYQPNNPPKKEKSELTDKEIEDFKRLFGKEYSKSDKEAAWLLVAFKSLSYYESNGYNISGYNETLHKKFFEFTKDGQKLNVYPRSAKGDLLYITIQAWEQLDNDGVELFVLKKNNIHQIIRSKEELLIDGDKLLFSMNILDPNKKISAVNNLFNKESINELKYDFNSEMILIVRMNNTPEFKSLFEGFGNENKDLYSFGNV
ncbi:hypothetical protein [Pedobacter sp. WC2423]|uniref:sacsin N-terminal ATP-binding-like domain-containing protein n=1 Tax=Pedobacter sp. WC2423 TaxID=3234142 RepID=UPI003467E616